MSKGSWKRSGGRVSGQDPEDGDRYHHVEKSPARTLNSFGVIKIYPTDKYKEGWDRIFGKTTKRTDDTREADGEHGKSVSGQTD